MKNMNKNIYGKIAVIGVLMLVIGSGFVSAVTTTQTSEQNEIIETEDIGCPCSRIDGVVQEQPVEPFVMPQEFFISDLLLDGGTGDQYTNSHGGGYWEWSDDEGHTEYTCWGMFLFILDMFEQASVPHGASYFIMVDAGMGGGAIEEKYMDPDGELGYRKCYSPPWEEFPIYGYGNNIQRVANQICNQCSSYWHTWGFSPGCAFLPWYVPVHGNIYHISIVWEEPD
jgi:hypothetical protein